jgi:hypothetical protein
MPRTPAESSPPAVGIARPSTPVAVASVEAVVPWTPGLLPFTFVCCPSSPIPAWLTPCCPVPVTEVPLTPVPLCASPRTAAEFPVFATLKVGFAVAAVNVVWLSALFETPRMKLSPVAAETPPPTTSAATSAPAAAVGIRQSLRIPLSLQVFQTACSRAPS